MNEMTERGLKVAEFLLQIKAIELRPTAPFTWASGLQSPIYCDNHKTLSYPRIRTYLRQQFVELIENEFGKPEVIAGVATGGIALGVLVAQEMELPFVYVRSEAKKHGLTNQVEGALEAGRSVVVIEDLVSTGKSSLNAVQALRDCGAQVKGLVAIFSYGFAKAHEAFEKEKCPWYTLSNFDLLLQQSVKSKYISKSQLATLQNWKNNPEEWSARHGLMNTTT